MASKLPPAPKAPGQPRRPVKVTTTTKTTRVPPASPANPNEGREVHAVTTNQEPFVSWPSEWAAASYGPGFAQADETPHPEPDPIQTNEDLGSTAQWNDYDQPMYDDTENDDTESDAG